MSSILSINNISKSYGAIRALNDVSFSVPRGSVFGILGPNGSGKTTLLGIVMEVLHASSGSFSWDGQPGSSDLRKKIGTLLETPNFYHYLSGRNNLEIAAAIKQRGQNDINRVLETVNLLQRGNSKFSSYSLGMKQRLAIASALLGDPEILVFDEPTNGLDPAGIAEIRELIKQLNRQGKTIVMASHILDEVEKVCSHVAIIQKGVLKTTGTVSEVLSGSSSNDNTVLIEVGADDLPSLQSVLNQLPGIISAAVLGNTLQLVCTDTLSPEQINAYCFEKGITLGLLGLKRKNLEARFLEITGNQSDR
jgi:ABC-2 type transport system ATP-binding protein